MAYHFSDAMTNAAPKLTQKLLFVSELQFEPIHIFSAVGIQLFARILQFYCEQKSRQQLAVNSPFKVPAIPNYTSYGKFKKRWTSATQANADDVSIIHLVELI
jgi:hypothetical protein